MPAEENPNAGDVVNPAFVSLTGLPDPTGRRVTELIPGIREADPDLFDRYARVVATGEEDYNRLINIVLPLLDETALFRARWGLRANPPGSAAWAAEVRDTLRPLLARVLADAAPAATPARP